MNIQLFNPPVHHYAGVHYRMNPPLGLPILAAVLDRADHNARVYDLEAMQITPDKLAASFDKQRAHWPDAVGFTMTHHNARGLRECIQALRDVDYTGYIVVGGPEATLTPALPLTWGADTVVVGEAEGNAVDIFERQPRGVVYGQQEAISLIPGPLWRVHTPSPVEYYGNEPNVGRPESIAMWSRGCPHSCTFCGNPVFGRRRVCRKPTEAIYDDMATLKALGAKAVFVYDDELPGMPGGDDWLVDVCKTIQPLELAWKCQGRCTTKLTKGVLEAMHDAGCKVVMWGVESFSQCVLDAMHKGTTEADIWHTLRLAHEVGLSNWLFMMVGNYGETSADLAYTEKRLAEATRAGLVQYRQVTITTPVPGTELYEAAKREGWLVESPESGPQMHQVYQDTPWLKARDIRYWHARLERAGL